MPLIPLSGTSTFYDWYITTNDIIDYLNSINVYGATSGDGVKLETDPLTKIITGTIGGTSGNIVSGLTFSGKVSFTGEVVVPNVSYKILGITSGTSGYSFGSVIRLNGATGYTLAKANSPDNAESIGIISAKNTSYSVVSLLGKISGDFTKVAGRTLNAGCVYFLDPNIPGGITTNEPVMVGQVSKPVIMGLSADTGIIVQYRGNYINGSTPLGMSGNNRIYVILPNASASNGFEPGVFVSYLPNVGNYQNQFDTYITATGRTLYDGWFISQQTSTTQTAPGLHEEDFVVGMIETSQTFGGSKIYQIVTKGATETLPGTVATSSGVYGWWILNESQDPTDQLYTSQNNNNDSTTERLYVGYNYNNTSFIVDIKPIIRNIGSFTTNIALSPKVFTSAKNETFNGDFSVWQRSTGRSSQYTGNSAKIYFADQWVRRTSRTSGVSQYLQRQAFTKTQTLVEGSPDYYVDIKCLINPALPWSDDYHSIGHILPNIQSLNNKNITVSFYAKCSNSNYSANVYMSRYNGTTLVNKTIIGTVNLSTSWSKYTLNYKVAALSAGSYADDYVEIGVDIEPLVKTAHQNAVAIGTNIYVSVASFCVYDDTYTSPKHIFEMISDKELKAKQYYYTTYSEDQIEQTATLTSAGEISLNTSWFQYTPSSTFKYEKLPIKMRKTPTVSLYSPSTGALNDAYNLSAGLDLRNTTGTIGYSQKTRVAPLNTKTISTSADATTIKVNVENGAVPFDTISYHIIADASYPL